MKKFFAIIFVIFFFVLCASLYTATLRGVAGDLTVASIRNQEHATEPFELSPERGRFAHVVSLAETGKFPLSKELADFVYPDVGWYQGRFYSFFAPGISYLAEPFYNLGNKYNLAQVSVFGLVSLMGLLSLLTLFFIAKNILRLPLWASLVSVFIFGFGSTSWSYAITLYQHMFTVFFMLSGFYAVWKYSRSVGVSAFLWASWVWISYGLAVTVDYPNAVLLLPNMVYFLHESISFKNVHSKVTLGIKWSFVLTSLFFVTVSMLHGYHNSREFGSWKSLSGSIVDYKVIVTNKLQNLPISDITQKVSDIAKRKSNVAVFFSEEKFPNSFGTLMFSKDRGLFFYMPIFLLGVLGVIFSLKKYATKELLVLLALVSVNIFLYSSWGDPWGGWAYGPRYLIPSMSILSLFVAKLLAESKGVWFWRVVSVFLFAFSSCVSLLGALTTNALPPRIEADFLHTQYNFLFNLKFLNSGKSGSFIYNTYLSDRISLMDYFTVIYSVLMLIFVFLVIAGPLLVRRKHD